MSDADSDLTNPPDTVSGGAPEEPDKPDYPQAPQTPDEPGKPEEPDRTEEDGTPVENPSG